MYRMLILTLGLFIFNALSAQNLTGKWVGYFTTHTGMTFPYELIIQDDGNANLTATTLTRFSNNSSAKAFAKGTFSKASNLVSILETKFELLTIAPNTQACLMSNYLTYSTNKDKSYLQGTYISNNTLGTTDCGSGTVSLIKETNYLLAKKIDKPIKNNNTKKEIVKLISAEKQNKKDTNQLKESLVINAATKALEVDVPINKATAIKIDSIETKALASKPMASKEKKYVPIPWVLISRDNKLIKTLFTNNQKVSIDLFDNGSFDSDSISVYDNNVLLFDKIKLSYKEFHFELTLNENISKHELVLVAHKSLNATRNSSILIFKDNGKKEEFFINTNQKSNAKIIIQYDLLTKSFH